MNWFLLSLVGPILWAATNHIDKFLITKYFKGGGVGSLLIFSALFSLLLTPVALYFAPNALSINPKYAVILVSCSVLWVIGLIFYLHAMQKGETSLVVPLFQTIPVFGYILAYFFLGENLTVKQILASLLIIAGAIALSLDLSQERISIKSSVLFLMLISSFLTALGGVIFKFVALKTDFWMSTFWNQLGAVLVGIFLVVFIKSYRREFFRVLNTNTTKVLAINGLNEVLSLTAGLAVSYATLLTSLTLVWVVNGFQPFFVFLIGIILTLFFPHLGSESLVKKHLVQKIASIVVIFIGTYFLNS